MGTVDTYCYYNHYSDYYFLLLLLLIIISTGAISLCVYVSVCQSVCYVCACVTNISDRDLSSRHSHTHAGTQAHTTHTHTEEWSRPAEVQRNALLTVEILQSHPFLPSLTCPPLRARIISVFLEIPATLHISNEACQLTSAPTEKDHGILSDNCQMDETETTRQTDRLAHK